MIKDGVTLPNLILIKGMDTNYLKNFQCHEFGAWYAIFKNISRSLSSIAIWGDTGLTLKSYSNTTQ